jgi:BCCT family betaine/carnitine transporter
VKNDFQSSHHSVHFSAQWLKPFAEITSVIGIALVIIFFVTSMDSGSLVVDTIAAGGKTDAPTIQRALWCTFGWLTAIALMLGGGLSGLQAATLVTGLPFAIVLMFMCACLVMGLKKERALHQLRDE